MLESMGGASMRSMSLPIPWSYPELILAFACFLLVGLQRSRSSKEVIMKWPAFGMLPSLLLHADHIHDWLTEKLRDAGGSLLFTGPCLTQMNYFCTCNPANINYIFNTRFSSFPKGPEFSRVFDFLGNGIFNSDGDSWSIQRKMAHTLISGQKFRAFVAKRSQEKVEKCLIPLLEHIARGGGGGEGGDCGGGAVVDLQHVFQRFAFDSTCVLVFGEDPGCLESDFPTVPFAEAMDRAMEALFFRHVLPESWWMLQRRLNVGKEKKFAEARKTVDRFVRQHVTVRRQEIMESRNNGHRRRDGEEEEEDLLTSYIHYQHQQLGDDPSKSDEFLRDTIVNLLLAGRDTTSAALTWFFWLVCRNPRVESKILQEVTAKFDLRADDTRSEELVYLHAALCESLRLYPPVPFEHKSVLKPEEMPTGEFLEAGTKVLISLYSIARMKSIWGDDCSEFKPERWICEDTGRLRREPSYKFMAFNSGPRNCLGKEVAFTQMKAAAALLLYNFRFEVVEGHAVAPKLSIILHMRDGLRVKVRKRDPTQPASCPKEI